MFKWADGHQVPDREIVQEKPVERPSLIPVFFSLFRWEIYTSNWLFFTANIQKIDLDLFIFTICPVY